MTLPRATLERFRNGDPQAFAEVVRAHRSLVARVTARYWRSTFEREEAMQEIWAHVFNQRATFDLERADTLPGWLATLARRRALDLLKRPEDPATLASDDGIDGLETDDVQADPAELRELTAAVEGFAAGLRANWRQFFQLYFAQGLDYAEIATAMRISKLRCKYMKKVLLGRARKNAPLMSALGRAHSGGKQ